MAERAIKAVPPGTKLSHLRGKFYPSPTYFTQINRHLIEPVTKLLREKDNGLAVCYHGFLDDACHPFKDSKSCHIKLLEFIPIARECNKRIFPVSITAPGNETLAGSVNPLTGDLKIEVVRKEELDEK